MTAIARPNAWAAADSSAAKLTYSPTVNPAPLTVSAHDRAPTLGSLVVVIGNDSGADVTVDAITFVVQIGKKPAVGGNPLMAKPPAEALVSEPERWSFKAGTEPSGGEGPMEFTLTPKPQMGPLKAGESLMVELIDFQTVEETSSSTVKISEEFSGGGEASLAIPTLPAGFFFDSLVATVEKGSTHTPVSEVGRGGKVVLLWSTSAALGKQKIHYSNAATGEKVEPAKEPGRWESSELTADTVFVVTVEETGAAGEALPAALATAVAVRDPALIAKSLAAETIEASGAVTVKGAVEAASAKVTGKLTAAELTATGASTITGQFSLGGTVTSFGKFEEYSPGSYKTTTDGLAVAGAQCLPVPCGESFTCSNAVNSFRWIPLGVGRLTKISDDATPRDEVVLFIAP
ncbi:MAG TPA: hypothetical protein VFI17_10500 [Solirubrobacterales bacterium]|nr:hypothetical protein [Solirubrobacterales bacterium]